MIHFLVAVSGGPDSLSLLHALHSHGYSVSVAHLNHGLRTEAEDEARFVERFCEGLGVPCVVGRADLTGHRGSVQEAARAARYAFLEKTAQEVGADRIATAHTQDDQVETILLNILRGTGLDGLRGIPAQRGIYIRPLLDVSRAEIEAYCRLHGLTPRRDPSNADPTHYTRNRIRLELLPLLEQEYHRSVRASLLRLAETAGRDADYLNAQADGALAECTVEQTSERLVLDSRRLRELHPAILRRTLRAACARMRGTGLGLTHDHVEAVCDALHGGRRLPFGLTTPPPHCAVRVTLRRLILTTRPASAPDHSPRSHSTGPE